MVSNAIQVPYLDTETLRDTNGLGRERPWRTHKMANEYLSMAYEEINPDKALRLRECASTLSFSKQENGKLKLVGARFCRVRLCPVCTWRRSLKVAGQMKEIMNDISNSDKPLAYIFLTLTIKNCDGEALSSTIGNTMLAFNALCKQTAFKRIVKGWYRGLEVTHNVDPSSDNFDTYHPHFHVVLGVNSSYFTGRDYINHDQWVGMWRKALKVDYDPIVNVKRVKGDTAKAVAEAAKYSVKASDIIVPDDWDLTVSTLAILDSALHQRRLVAFGGRFKEVHAKLKLDDAEDGDLVHTTDTETENTKEHVYNFAWYSGYKQYGRI